MTHERTSSTTSRTRGLAGLVAGLALLLATLSFAAGAQAAISKAGQASKAAGQASFFCLAWHCQCRLRRAAAYSGTTLLTVWRLNQPRNIFGHGNCRTYADVAIRVNSAGTVSSRLIRCA